MNIAVASGKGGTGKTTVAVNLAWILPSLGIKTAYIDCDVEEPNGHLFLHPEITERHAAFIPVPEIDTEKCAACGECVRSCEFNALARLGETVMVFDELCHGCGGCMAVCPNRAVSERKKTIGFVESGTAGDTAFVHGRLNVGEAMSPPLIRSVLKCADAGAVNIIDAPPGSSCPVIATVRDAGFVLLVTEPTPFGLNDLSITLDMVNELHRPHGVIINRSGPGDDEVRALCASRRTDVIGGITDDRRIAEACSRGEITAAIMPGVRGLFLELWQSISERAGV